MKEWLIQVLTAALQVHERLLHNNMHMHEATFYIGLIREGGIYPPPLNSIQPTL